MRSFGRKLALRLALVCALAVMGAAVAVQPSFAQGQGPFQTTPDGLQFRDLQIGDGPEAAPGDVVQIHFVGWLDENGARGRQIYNSRGEGRPISFVVGTDRVMEGWNQAVVGMRVGGRRLALVPPHLAFGDRAIEDVIPRRAFLTVIIELLSLEPRAE